MRSARSRESIEGGLYRVNATRLGHVIRSLRSALEEAAAVIPVPLVSTHTHTDLSLCGRPDMTFGAVVETAQALDFQMVALTDHVHIGTVTDYGAHSARLRQYRALRDALRIPLHVVVGGEFEVAAPGRMVVSDEVLAECECVVAAPNHYQLDWVQQPPVDAAGACRHELDCIETAVAWPHTQVLAHPFAGTGVEHTPNELFRHVDRARLRDLVARAVEVGVACELQPKFWYQGPAADRVGELFRMWLDAGGKLALGSDAHTLSSLHRWQERYVDMVRHFELTRADLWWPSAGEEEPS